MGNIIAREYIGLPEEYWHKQNFCWYMHDVILSIFRDCTKEGRMDNSFKIKDEIQARELEETENIINWLYKNGYEHVANNTLGIEIFHAILADMCSFIYESLNTIENGKITVSLALLRKPFRDNLLYLEWLLADPKEFINMVNNQDIEKYAIEKISKDKKINIIKSAIEKLDNQEYFSSMDEIFYYDLRYNYKPEYSLQRVWNKASHLVTTGNHIKSNEFNFIFSGQEEDLDFIEYYYNQVPHLLFYTYNIVIKLYNTFIRETSDATKIYNNHLILYKFCDLINTVIPQDYFNEEMKILLSFPCENCKKIIRIDLFSNEFNGFRNGWGFTCPECRSDVGICKYIFWEDYREKICI